MSPPLQKVLLEQVLPGIEAKHISGYKKVEILRIELEDGVNTECN
jgi:hypothetical protein